MAQVAKWLMVVAGAAGAVASAQAADGARHRNDSWGFEVAGFGGWTTGGEFKWQGGGAIVNDDVTATGSRIGLNDHSSFAIAAGMRASDSTSYEVFYSREASQLQTPLRGSSPADVTVSYLQLGGTLVLDESDRPLKPYAIGGLGITRLSPGESGDSRTRPSASLGLGLRWAATEHLSLRLEGRGFVTLMNNNAVFCKSDQNGLLCRVHGDGTTFIQGQFLAGVAFAF
ncbi:MAG: outer membrane beta-barrel protein [Proteobacteria bacterium]|nr:outer membrane beta-barrel protein [Pseudomonadota bacterium]